MRIGIIPFSNFHGRHTASVGSSFLRAEGLAATDPEFEIWQHGAAYTGLIFQKVYWKEMMQLFKGPKILDLCDPDWVGGKVNVVETGNMADAITCSSVLLTRVVQNFFPDKPVVHVPDRLNFRLFPAPRAIHKGRARTAVWFGYIHNAEETLGQLIPSLISNSLTLRIVADKDYRKKEDLNGLTVEYIPYRPHSAYHDISSGDILLNPRSAKALFKFKSGNKTIIGWKLGLPVAETAEDLERLMDAAARNAEVEKGKRIVTLEHDVALSAVQYREIFSSIQRGAPVQNAAYQI